LYHTKPFTDMSVITNVESWGNSHRPGFLDIFRILLGIFITYKGLQFITHMDDLENTTSGITTWFAGAALAHYIIFAHILGGPLIAAGLFTRIVCVMQLPILLGAVIFVNYPKGFMSIGNHMELWVSLLVLAGLVTFIIFGAGRYSIDAKRRREMPVTH
jgi:putative oxidoreductase